MKVFVTGTGVMTSLGNDVDTLWTQLVQGGSGVRHMPEWEQYRGLHCHLGAPVGPYEIAKIPRHVRRAMSRMSEMGALATFQALNQAGLGPGAQLNSSRTLLILGSTSGSAITLETYFKKLFEKHGPEGQVSTSFFKVMNHSVAANVAAALEFTGSLMAPSCACATSTQALVIGAELIRAGLYDVVIAGGADELHYISAAVFDVVMAASRGSNHDPDRASRPFDKNRDGLVVSEGAGVVVLESEDHACRRGARPLAEMRGGAYLCDGTHMTQSSASTMSTVMKESLRRSGLRADQIGYVNAHATSTIHGDLEESRGIGDVFGPEIPVSSLKGHLGHSLAACGAIEAIACVEMMNRSKLIPTRNLTEIDPQCAGVHHVTEVEERSISAILSNNFAFGGMNTSLILSRV